MQRTGCGARDLKRGQVDESDFSFRQLEPKGDFDGARDGARLREEPGFSGVVLIGFLKSNTLSAT